MAQPLDPDCLFCKIIRGDIPAGIVKRTDDYVVLRDIAPQAPEHLLVIPAFHVPAISHHADHDALGGLVAAAAQLGAETGKGNGFRLVVNEGPEGGQTVDHLHVHVLAGRRMSWPPG